MNNLKVMEVLGNTPYNFRYKNDDIAPIMPLKKKIWIVFPYERNIISVENIHYISFLPLYKHRYKPIEELLIYTHRMPDKSIILYPYGDGTLSNDDVYRFHASKVDVKYLDWT